MLKIFIWGYYGFHNTGDDAMLYSFLQTFKNVEDVKIAILSKDSVLVPRISCELFQVNPKITSVISTVIRSEMTIIVGGSHLEEKGKFMRSFRNISRIFFLAILIKAFNKKLVLFANGIGPFKHSITKYLVKSIIISSYYISVRDQASLNIVKFLWKKKKVIRSFDLSLCLSEKIILDNKNDQTLNIGISLLPYFEIYYNLPKLDELLLIKLTHSLTLLKNYFRFRCTVFEFHGPGTSSDSSISTEFVRMLKGEQITCDLSKYNENPIETLRAFDVLDRFIGMRYHACLFAYLREIPLLAISYHEKINTLSSDVLYDKNSNIDIEDFFNISCFNKIYRLIMNPEEFKPKLNPNKFRKQLRKDITYFHNLLKAL